MVLPNANGLEHMDDTAGMECFNSLMWNKITSKTQTKIWAFWLSLSLIFFQVSHAVPINNGVKGEPSIGCRAGAIDVNFDLENAFNGKIYVKGHIDNSQCVKDYTKNNGNTNDINHHGEISVNFGMCNLDKQRTVNPKGVYMQITVVIQFHRIFLTKVDRAYHIRCFYRQAEKSVSQGLEISMLTTTNLQESYPMPLCTYSIRKGNYDGPPISFLKVGDPVFHRWECKSTAGYNGAESPYGMLVHSCHVEDGSGESVQLVDSYGCGIDPYILGHPTYSPTLLEAYREAHAFKFADKNVVSFSCEIRLCFKNMNTCDGMTPPKCAPLKNKRSVDPSDYPVLFGVYHNLTSAGTLPTDKRTLALGQQRVSSDDVSSIDIQTRQFIVFDTLDLPPKRAVPDILLDYDSGENICIAYTTAGILWFVLGLFCILMVIFGILLVRKNNKLSTVDSLKLSLRPVGSNA